LRNRLSEDSLDKIFFALADRNRRKILKKLSEGDASVSTLAETVSISLPGTLKHLSILKEAKLIKEEKNGRIKTCASNPAGLDVAQKYVEEYKAFWNERFDNIETLLNRQNSKDKP
jgi:DNA-binding transcriptional ArsR family regulator